MKQALALPTASMTLEAFSKIWAGVKERLPMPTRLVAATLSILNSTRPAFTALDSGGDVVGHSARLRIGHQALGPEHARDGANRFHRLGSCYGNVKFEPTALDLLHQILQSRALGARIERDLGLSVNTSTRTFLPVPFWQGRRPRTIWSPAAGSTPRRKDNSTVS